jgi:hypothetical protein
MPIKKSSVRPNFSAKPSQCSLPHVHKGGRLSQVKRPRKSDSAEQGQPPDTTGLDSAWPSLSVEMTSAAYREQLPTPHDDNPIRHFFAFSERSEKPRDKLPTLREIDPLRYDFVP